MALVVNAFVKTSWLYLCRSELRACLGNVPCEALCCYWVHVAALRLKWHLTLLHAVIGFAEAVWIRLN